MEILFKGFICFVFGLACMGIAIHVLIENANKDKEAAGWLLGAILFIIGLVFLIVFLSYTLSFIL